jgi:hypothetical protein
MTELPWLWSYYGVVGFRAQHTVQRQCRKMRKALAYLDPKSHPMGSHTWLAAVDTATCSAYLALGKLDAGELRFMLEVVRRYTKLQTKAAYSAGYHAGRAFRLREASYDGLAIGVEVDKYSGHERLEVFPIGHVTTRCGVLVRATYFNRIPIRVWSRVYARTR